MRLSFACSYIRLILEAIQEVEVPILRRCPQTAASSVPTMPALRLKCISSLVHINIAALFSFGMASIINTEQDWKLLT